MQRQQKCPISMNLRSIWYHVKSRKALTLTSGGQAMVSYMHFKVFFWGLNTYLHMQLSIVGLPSCDRSWRQASRDFMGLRVCVASCICTHTSSILQQPDEYGNSSTVHPRTHLKSSIQISHFMECLSKCQLHLRRSWKHRGGKTRTQPNSCQHKSSSWNLEQSWIQDLRVTNLLRWHLTLWLIWQERMKLQNLKHNTTMEKRVRVYY